MMEAVRTSETSVDNNFTRQYKPEDNYERVYSWIESPNVILTACPCYISNQILKSLFSSISLSYM
jgi:hypothetical protein